MKKNLLIAFVVAMLPFLAVAQSSGNGKGNEHATATGLVVPYAITINGIPFNEHESQHSYFITMPDFAYSVDNNQLQRGPGYADNGAGSFGAFMNVQSTPRRDSVYLELNNTYGSLSTWRTILKGGSGLVNNKFSLDGRLSYINSDGFMNRSNCDIRSYFITGAYYGTKSLLRVNAFLGQEYTNELWATVPQNEMIANRNNNPYSYEGQTDNYGQTHLQALYAYHFSPKTSVSGAAHYSHAHGFFEENPGNQYFSNYSLPVNNITGGLVRRRHLDTDFYGLTYALNHVPQKNLKLVWGGNYYKYNGTHFGDVLWAQNLQVNNPSRYAFDQADKDVYLTFGGANYQIGKFAFLADLQYRRVEYTFSGFNGSLGDIGQGSQFNFFNSKLGISYQLNEKDKVYVSYSIANNEPRREQFINSTPTTRPQRQHWNNIGIGYNTKREKLTLGVDIFGLFYKDQLVALGRRNAVGEFLDVNVPDSYRVGVELEGKVQIHPRLTWTTTGVLSQSRIKIFTDPDSKVVYTNTAISSSPNLVAASQIAFSPCKKTEVALINKYIGKQYRDNTSNDNNSIDAFFVHDLRLRYTSSFKRLRNIGASLLVNNIFGATYDINTINAANYNYVDKGFLINKDYYFPQAQQNFLVALNVGF